MRFSEEAFSGTIGGDAGKEPSWRKADSRSGSVGLACGSDVGVAVGAMDVGSGLLVCAGDGLTATAAVAVGASLNSGSAFLGAAHPAVRNISRQPKEAGAKALRQCDPYLPWALNGLEFK